MAQILLPELGEGITSVEISDVSVKVGDNLSIDDILIVVETDKTSMEIPTTEAGQVSIVHISTGGSLSPGEPIVTLSGEASSTETNKKVEEPIYSYKTHKRLKKNKVLFSKKIIIIEGLHIFCDKRIINLIDFGIYLDLDENTRLQRRIKRDVSSRSRSIKEVEQRYFTMCKPMHEKYIDCSKEHADIILKSKDISFKNVLNLILNKIRC